MQSCDYCGRENEEPVHYCIECGTSFVDEVTISEALSLSAALRRDMAAAGAIARRHKVRLRRVMYVLSGFCWILFAVAIGLFLAGYVAEGAGLQFLGLGVSSLTVLSDWCKLWAWLLPPP
jgi:uncharacterized membrane protein YvbJ